MGITVNGQILEALYALALGAAFAVLYDFLRALRRRAKKAAVTALLDAFFWLICAFAFFLFGMTVLKGQQRIFIFGAAAIGFLLCLWLFEDVSAIFWNGIFHILGLISAISLVPLRYTEKILKKFLFLAKKLFHNQIKQRIMYVTYLCFKSKKRKKINKYKGAERIENKTGRYYY